ncbi:hypothetical protein KFU94_16610 [Chloroflexi bacterium TSY]|nr:hypothetical protein [Chloroflexi bacterium TSY]
MTNRENIVRVVQNFVKLLDNTELDEIIEEINWTLMTEISKSEQFILMGIHEMAEEELWRRKKQEQFRENAL